MADRGIAAVYHQLLTKNEVRCRAREEHYGIGDFRRIAEPAGRKFVHIVPAELLVFREFPSHVGDVECRSHGINVDPVLPPLGCQRPCQEQEATLRGAIRGKQREADLCQDRGDVDDFATTTALM